MIQLTQDEVNAFNIISQQLVAVKSQSIQVEKAQRAFIVLLEMKYKAKFNEQKGTFEPESPKDIEQKTG